MEAGRKERKDELAVNLFLAAMACPPEQREAFVGEACAGNGPLREEVRRRVEWEVRLHGFLLTPVVGREKLDQPFAVGDTVMGRFRIVRVAGEGGMGVVYEAFDEKLQRRMALKCPRFEFRRRLSPEVQNSLRVTHPNVCRVFEIYTAETNAGEVDFLSMEFIDGETLAARFATAPPRWLETTEGAAIAQQLCAGLQAVHARGVVHRDLKAGNIMLTPEGRAVIMDFGIATGSEFLSSQVRGTPDYVAPELWRGEAASPRSDLYALGVVLYEMASGRKPFGVGTEWHARLHEVPALTDVAEPARSAIRRCLQPDAAKRYGDAGEVAVALRRNVARRRLLIGGTVAAGAAGSLAKWTYWPSSPVRLAILPAAMRGVAGEDRKLIQGFLGDVFYRLRSLRRVRRPLIVFDPAEFAAAGFSPSAAGMGATHLLSTTFEAGRASAELRDAPSGKVIERYTRAGGRLPELLLAMQSGLVQGIIEHLRLRADSPPQTLNGNAYANYLQGLHYARFDFQNGALAIPFFERVIAEAPGSALGYAGLAEALLSAGNARGDRSQDGRALDAIATAERLDPQSSHVHLIAGRFYTRGGQYQRALAETQLAAELAPHDAEAYIPMAYALFYLRRPREAEAALLAAIQMQPGYYKPHLELGLAYFELRDFPRAEQHWLEAVRLAPGLTKARLNLAAIYQRDGRLAEARQMAGEILAIRKTSVALELWGNLQPPAEAVATYQEALRLGPPRYTTWASLATAYLETHREGDALGAFRSGLRFVEDRLSDRPSDPEMVAWCAYYHARLGETGFARSRAVEAEASQSVQGNVRYRLILTHGWLNDVDTVKRLLDGAPPDLLKELRRSPELPPALRRTLAAEETERK